VSQEIVNRVASSPLITVDLKDYIPKGERVEYDLKHDLYQGMILKEKEFRSSIRDRDWSEYKGKHVAVHCSEDSIIPKWAYMLLASKLAPFASTIFFGNLDQLENELLIGSIKKINAQNFKDKKLVVKGCGDKELSEAAFMEIVVLFQPVAASIMYGEPCSTVPVYKKQRK
jgi:hypothetical protein